MGVNEQEYHDQIKAELVELNRLAELATKEQADPLNLTKGQILEPEPKKNS